MLRLNPKNLVRRYPRLAARALAIIVRFPRLKLYLARRYAIPALLDVNSEGFRFPLADSEKRLDARAGAMLRQLRASAATGAAASSRASRGND